MSCWLQVEKDDSNEEYGIESTSSVDQSYQRYGSRSWDTGNWNLEQQC